jgi:hypothetical protein
MNDEEHVFDYMAAAEETGRQLDLLIRQMPGHIKSTLAAAFADEWREVTAFKELSEATGELNEVINEVREAVASLRQTVWMVTIVGIVVAVAIPLITWFITNR